MNKILLLWVILSLSSTAFAKAAYTATAECQFDYDDFDFCSKRNISKYKTALAKQSPNYDATKILLNVGSPQYIRYVVIETQTGVVFPLSDAILGFKDATGGLTGKSALIEFSIHKPQLCIQGSLDAYRDAYDNVKVCYALKKDQSMKYGQVMRRVEMPVALK